MQHDTEAYYIIGFHSTNPARDGGYRHLTINILNHPDAKLEYRPGYYAPADFQHAKSEDRELAMTEQMRSDVPATDVAVYLQALYFQLADGKFYIPISLVVPARRSTRSRSRTRTRPPSTSSARSRTHRHRRGTGTPDRASRRRRQPATAEEERPVLHRLQLAPGKYHVKFVVRENQSGNMGSFETDIQVPDMKKAAAEAQLHRHVQPAHAEHAEEGRRSRWCATARSGCRTCPHVFRQDQHLFFLYEVYAPAKDTAAPGAGAAAPGLTRREGGAVRVLTSIEFLLGGVKVYETPLVEATAINIPERDAVGFQFDVPLAGLKPGTYVCQVNVIDDAGGNFSFPRMALRITPAWHLPRHDSGGGACGGPRRRTRIRAQ